MYIGGFMNITVIIKEICLIIATLLTSLIALIEFISKYFDKNRKEIRKQQFLNVTLPLAKFIDENDNTLTADMLNEKFKHLKNDHYELIPIVFLKYGSKLNQAIAKGNKGNIAYRFVKFHGEIIYFHNQLSRKLGYPSENPINVLIKLNYRYIFSKLACFGGSIILLCAYFVVISLIILLIFDILLYFTSPENNEIHWFLLIIAIIISYLAPMLKNVLDD